MIFQFFTVLSKKLVDIEVEEDLLREVKKIIETLMKSSRNYLQLLLAGFVVTLKSRTDSCSITGTGTAAGSAGMGGARVDVEVEEDLLREVK